MSRSYTSPAQVAQRLVTHYPTLWVDADHALACTLITNGNGRRWSRGRLVDIYGFDGKSAAKLRREKAEREARRAREAAEEEQRRQQPRQPDPEFDAIFEKIMADVQADHARRASDPAYKAEQDAKEAARKAVLDRQHDPAYRKQALLLNLSSYSGMVCFPANITPAWATAIRKVAAMVLELPDDFEEARLPGQGPRGSVAAAKKIAADVVVRLAERSAPGFKPQLPY